MRVICLLIVAAAWLALPAPAAAELVDDFEAGDAPSPWEFSNGAEFPGATGSLAVDAGRSGQGARLAYDFSGGGAYVAMRRTLDNHPLGQTLVFWVRADPRTRLVVRLEDETGQTLQYELQWPFEAVEVGAWTQLGLAPGTAAGSHWGGADDGVLHGSLTAISILVNQTGYGPRLGAVELDDVAFVATAPLVLDPFGAGHALGPEAADLFDHLGANIHFVEDDAALDALDAAGFTWVRMDLFWGWIETSPGVYDFGAYDGLLAALEARGMKAILILAYGNDLYGGGPPKSAAAIDAYGAFAEAAARHFAGKDVIFEIWNEPDVPGFWPPDGDPLEYAPLLAATIPRIRAGDANARVSSGGVAWVFFDYFAAMLGTGAANGVDFVGVHGYRWEGPESAIGDFQGLRQMVAEQVAGDPTVLQTEWGYTSTDYGGDGTTADARHRHAVYAVRAHLTSWASGTPVSIWYDVRDDCADATDRECNFGLLTHDYAKKPAMHAVETLASMARGRRMTTVLSRAETARVVRHDGDADLVIAAWATDEAAPSEVDAPTPVEAWDMYGEARALAPANGRVLLAREEGQGPVYLRYERATPWADAGPVDGDGSPVGADAGAHGSGDGGTPGGDDTDTPGGAGADVSSGCGCRAGGSVPRGGLAPLLLALFALVGPLRARR